MNGIQDIIRMMGGGGGLESWQTTNPFEYLLGFLTGGVKFPWQTPPGEGFIAPWTEKFVTPTGRWATPTSPFIGGAPGMGQVVKRWMVGSTMFFKLIDGKIGCVKKDGTIKTWRPARHIVISRNPRVNDLLRAGKKLDRLEARLARKLKPRRRTRAPVMGPGYFLSPAETKLITSGGK